MCKRWLFFSAFLSLLSFVGQAQLIPKSDSVLVVSARDPAPRLDYGAAQLVQALKDKGYKVRRVYGSATQGNRTRIQVDVADGNGGMKKEGYSIRNRSKKELFVAGADASGALYGCLELAACVRRDGGLQQRYALADAPQMVLRGACIGLQKPTYLPGRHVYEYPITEATFPWFYNKQLWLQVLDSMVENRMNSLYLWNGHPFASLVKLKDYPYAVEVDDATFRKNEEIYSFLTREADKRGIWVIQMFYNIIVSKPFAEKHGIATQDRNRPIVPVIADYTRKSIAAFVAKYPNVGLMVALGEAMEGVGQDDIDWFTKTIIPGVKDGLAALGTTVEPPIILRAHDTDAPGVIEASKSLYGNLYTEAKYNGEALTTYTPRGPWAELHRKLASLNSVQIENVHILANLEPFRYGSPDFIQKSVQAMHEVHQGNGLHLYPQASYWDWPYSADKTNKRLLQIERDWIWYKAWARYAWNADRKRESEKSYWAAALEQQFGLPKGSGSRVLAAYEETGEIAPKLLRRFGITDGNRQTLTLGMFMTQLVNPYRYGLFTLLYNSEGPEGEMLTEYAEKEWKGVKHRGETPLQVANEVRAHGRKAAMALAGLKPTKNTEEFERIRNDVACYEALANCFADKAAAAIWVLRYKFSNDIRDLKKADAHLEKSLGHYRRLVTLTKDAYLYANSMQTQQRKIPIGGNDGKNKTWEELLPFYQQELNTFRRRVDSLQVPTAAAAPLRPRLQNAVVQVDENIDRYMITTGKELFADTATYIKDFAEELNGLNGLKLPMFRQAEHGTSISFRNEKPVKVLVGYFNSTDKRYLQPPQLETDATANDRGQAEARIRSGLLISGLPPVSIHTFSFGAGANTLRLPKGICLVLGFVEDAAPFPKYDAGLQTGGVKKELDWLFE